MNATDDNKTSKEIKRLQDALCSEGLNPALANKAKRLDDSGDTVEAEKEIIRLWAAYID